MIKKFIKPFFLIATMLLFISISQTTAFADTTTVLHGSVKGLTIIVNFSDEVTTTPQSEIDDLLNKTGYSANGNNGSIKDYYSNVSYGALQYTNTVVTYNSPNPKSFYDDESSCGPDGQAVVLVKDALQSISDNNPSAFSELTTQNGEVALTILYAGDVSSQYLKGLYHHSGYIGNLQYGGLNFNNYALTNIGDIPYIGILAHETGHMLCSWPDTYNGTGNGPGDYDLMSQGNSLADYTNPAWPNPYLRCIVSGWGNVKSLNTYANNSDIIASAYYHDVYMYTTDTPYEYFLIENLQQPGRPDAGIIIWHIDELYYTHTLPLPAPYNNKTPNLVSVVQADGLYSLERDQNRGLEGDLFRGDGVKNFTTNTAVNSNLWDGTPSYLYITNISKIGTAMAFKYSKATDIENPAAPSNITMSNRNGLQIQLNWNPSTDNVGVDKYHLYADINTGTETYRKNIGYPSTGTSYPFTMEADKSYSFYVTAIDAQGNESAPSSAFTFSTNTLAPQAPTGLNFSSVTSNSANLSWNASTSPFGNVAYKIYDGTTYIGSTDSFYFSIKDLSPNTSHSYTVKAYVPSYESIVLSPSSNVVQVKTRAAALNNFILENKTDLQARFSWDASLGATKYHLYAKAESTLAYEYPIQIDFETTESFCNINLEANTYYRFYVKAVDASGYESDVSSEIILCTDNTTPEAITNLTASNITGRSVKLSWYTNNDPLNLRTYRIYDGTELVGETSDTQITLTGLAINSTHTYTVIAVGYNNTLSLQSNTVSVTTRITTPTNLDVIGAGGLSITLGWDFTDGADHYCIYADVISKDGITTKGVKMRDNITDTSSGIGVDPGFLYNFYIVSVDAYGNESLPSSNIVNFDRR